jgi:hypothetical protein
MNFAVSMNALGVFRSITDCIKDLPLSALNSMLLEKDLACILVYLVEKAPWIRRRKDGFENFEFGTWKKISEDDLMIVTSLEAQVWLALMNLLLEPEARKTYMYSKKNQVIILRVKFMSWLISS